MSEAKPTPGPWTTYLNTMDDVVIRKMNAAGDEECVIARKVSHRDARLIADAGTVHHQTGLTPSQLVERVKELEEAAKLVLDWYEAENDHSKTDFYQRVQMCRDSEDALRAALSKARPNTAEGEAHGQAPAGATSEPIAYLRDDGSWTPAKTEEGRKLNDWMISAGSPKIGVHLASTAQPTPVATPQADSVTAPAGCAVLGLAVGYRISDPDEPDLGHWLSEEPGAAWCVSEPLVLATPAQAAQAGSVSRPCHVFTVRKTGSLTEWEPTTMAFALPDGAHALYTLPQPAPTAQAYPAAAKEPSP